MFGVSNAEGGDHGGYHYTIYQRVGNQPALAEILLTPTLAAAVAMARAPGNGRVSVDDYPMVSRQKMGLGRTSPNVYERGVSKVVSRCILGSIQCLLKEGYFFLGFFFRFFGIFFPFSGGREVRGRKEGRKEERKKEVTFS